LEAFPVAFGIQTSKNRTCSLHKLKKNVFYFPSLEDRVSKHYSLFGAYTKGDEGPWWAGGWRCE